MKLVHLSDLHLNDAPVGGLDPVRQTELALAHIAKHHADAHAVVISGDLTHQGKRSSYQWLRDRLGILPFKPHLMIGNHDRRDNFRAVFPDRPTDPNGYIQHATDAGGYRLIMLDTVDDKSHAGLLGPQRLGWLAEQLDEAKRGRLPVLLFMHHNPVPSGVWALDLLSLADSDDFRAVLARHREGIRHLFFGHTHMSLFGMLEGVPFSAPRSSNHPCWPDLDPAHRLGFGPIAPNYHVAIIDERSTLIHTIDFMLDHRITYIDVPDPHAWVHLGLPTG